MISTHERGISPGHRGRLLVAATALAVLPFAACKETATITSPGGNSPAAQIGAQQAANRTSDETALSAHVVGAVARPTKIEVVPGLPNALDVLVSSPLTEDADLRHAALIRVSGDETSMLRIDIRKLMLSGNPSDNVLLQAGDIIYFPTQIHAYRTSTVLVDKPRIERGDLVTCVFPPDTKSGEELQLLIKPQAIGPAGTIFVPIVGSMPVVGLTTKEASEALNQALRKFFKDPFRIQVRASHRQSAK